MNEKTPIGINDFLIMQPFIRATKILTVGDRPQREIVLLAAKTAAAEYRGKRIIVSGNTQSFVEDGRIYFFCKVQQVVAAIDLADDFNEHHQLAAPDYFSRVDRP